MGPKQALELVRSAPERYKTVRAALRYRGDGCTMTAIEERYFRSEAYRRACLGGFRCARAHLVSVAYQLVSARVQYGCNRFRDRVSAAGRSR